MLEWVSKFMSAASANAAGIGAIAAVLTLLGSCIAWLYKTFWNTKPLQVPGQGGHGGSASVGGNGIAIGGRSGRGGDSSLGGRGGRARVGGDGIAIGGDGGDAGVAWRPALSAPSPVERQLALGVGVWPDHERDDFGFYTVGRGGDGGDLAATVVVGDSHLPLLPLVKLLRLWAPDVLNAADAQRPSGAQEFWEIVSCLDPATAQAAENHVRQCMDITIPQGLPAPNPYAPRLLDRTMHR